MPINLLFKRLLIALAIISSILIVACGIQVTAMGVPDQIIVYADSTLWREIEDDFRDIFEAEIATPHVETCFTVDWQPLSTLNSLKTRMNIFFLGVADEDNQVNQYILRSLPEEARGQVMQNERFYMFADNMFAKEQIGLFLFAKDRKTFRENLQKTKQSVFGIFNAKYMARLKKEMYDKGEQKDLERVLAENFGWKVRVQHDYFIANQNKEERYVWLRRIQPDRWLSAWRVKGDSSLISRDTLIALRNGMTRKYYEGDTVEEADTYLSIDQLNGNGTAKLVGLWRNDSLLVGGPFRLYAVFEPEEQALYLIDIAVMAPGRNKKPFLDQLEVIANTFEIVHEATLE